MDYFILNEDREPVPATREEWRAWCKTPDGRPKVAETVFENGTEITTWFEGQDVSFGGEDPPPLYMTFVSYGPEEGEQYGLYATWEDAEAGHVRVLRWLGVPVDQLDLDL